MLDPGIQPQSWAWQFAESDQWVAECGNFGACFACVPHRHCFVPCAHLQFTRPWSCAGPTRASSDSWGDGTVARGHDAHGRI